MFLDRDCLDERGMCDYLELLPLHVFVNNWVCILLRVRWSYQLDRFLLEFPFTGYVGRCRALGYSEKFRRCQLLSQRIRFSWVPQNGISTVLTQTLRKRLEGSISMVSTIDYVGYFESFRSCYSARPNHVKMQVTSNNRMLAFNW